MINLNGKDGGGQILRSALSLSILTGKPFRMTNIRGKRAKPGLMRQHLTCVKAAVEICDAVTDGAEMHSTELVFSPGKAKAGNYVFKIGLAGSTTLIFQTVLPVLMLLDKVSTVEIHGGTHNPMAPSADFIQRSFLPQMRSMGVVVDFDCPKIGFAPAGGGVINAKIHPVEKLQKLELITRGEVKMQTAQILLANVRSKVADTELRALRGGLDWPAESFEVKNLDNVDGSGNLISLEVEFDKHSIYVTSHGEFSKSAGKVASSALKALNIYLNSQAAIGVRLADQLLLPMALVGAGKLKTVALTNHMKTNIEVIQKFTQTHIEVDESIPGGVVITLSTN